MQILFLLLPYLFIIYCTNLTVNILRTRISKCHAILSIMINMLKYYQIILVLHGGFLGMKGCMGCSEKFGVAKLHRHRPPLCTPLKCIIPEKTITSRLRKIHNLILLLLSFIEIKELRYNILILL